MNSTGSGRTGMRFSAGLLICAGFLWLIHALVQQRSETTWYGYVLGEDRRAYMINLDTGELEWTSRIFDEIRVIVGAGFNPEELIVYVTDSYVGNVEPRAQEFPGPYRPLIAISLNEEKVIFEHEGGDSGSDVWMHPDGSVLYYYGGRLQNGRYITIADPVTGRIIGGLDIPFGQNSVFSPDGAQVSNVFLEGGPSNCRGEDELDQGRVITWDLATGERISVTCLVDNRGLYPPWGSPDRYLVDIEGRPRDESGRRVMGLDIYDRDSGEIIAKSIDFPILQGPPARIPGTGKVVLSTYEEVVVFDVSTAEVLSRIRVTDGARLESGVFVSNRSVTARVLQ